MQQLIVHVKTLYNTAGEESKIQLKRLTITI